MALRVAAVALAGLGLAVLRGESDRPFWPVLGSMFMFRLIVYLFEQRRAAAQPALGLAPGEFFPPPDVGRRCLPPPRVRPFRASDRPRPPRARAGGGVAGEARGGAQR